MEKIKSFLDLNLLKRNENINNKSIIPINKLINYYFHGVSILGNEVSKLELNENENRIIKKLSDNKMNKSIKEIEERLIKTIVENRNISLIDGYIKFFGDENLFNISKSKEKFEIKIKTFFNKNSFDYDKKVKTITKCVFSNLSTKGLKYLVEINCCNFYNLSEFDLVKNYEFTQNDQEEEKLFKFLNYYICQNKVRLNDKYWFFKLFEKLLIGGSCQTSIEPIERFTNLLKQYGYNAKFPEDSSFINVKDFNNYKWCLNYFVQSCGIKKEKILNHLPISFKIEKKEQVDFIFDNIYFNSLFDTFPNIMSVELSLYYIEKLENLKKLEGNEEMGNNERINILEKLLQHLHDASIAECDITTLEEISKLNLKFPLIEIIPFKESITKEELLNLINHLNSIDFKSFVQTRFYSFFYQISILISRFGINEQCKFSKSVNLTHTLVNAVGVLNYQIIDLILSDNSFRIDINEYNKIRLFKVQYTSPHISSFKESDDQFPPLPLNIIEKIIKKLLNSLQLYDIIQIQPLFELLYDCFLKESLELLPKINNGNNWCDRNIRNQLFEMLHLIEKDYQRHGIEIKTSIYRFSTWVSLKSQPLQAFITKFQPFISNNSFPLSIHIVNTFTFTIIYNLNECELFTKLRKLYLHYKTNNIENYFQFLNHYRLYDLMVQEINFKLNDLKRKKPKEILKQINSPIGFLIKCRISIEEFKKFQFKEFIESDSIHAQVIQKCIEYTILYDNLDLFKYFLSNYSNNIIFFEYSPIISNQQFDFLEYLLQDHINLFLKIYSQKKYKFDQIVKEKQFATFKLLIKYLPIDFFNDFKHLNQQELLNYTSNLNELINFK